ncbi:hypothetical protein ABT332_06490 [Saccharomonospora azurea]|uniref:hypothetical protein n=1 Tax=Saccharomonospora azurea TaxID=40988 RepID=UPI00332E959D
MARFMGNGGCGCCPDGGSVAVTGGETTTAKDRVTPDGVITTDVKVSNHPGNLLKIVGDGLMVDPADACEVNGSETHVKAGKGVMVSGNGTKQNPYIIEASGAPSAFSCSRARRCFEAGDGLDYNPSTGVFEVRPSGDPGNAVTIGEDGGLYVPGGNGGGKDCCCCPPAPAPQPQPADPIDVEGGESESAINTVDKDGDTFVVTPEVKISDEAGNTLQLNEDGLYVPAPEGGAGETEPTVVKAGDNVTVEGSGTSDDPYVIHVESPAAGGEPPMIEGGDTPTATTRYEGDQILADVKVSKKPGNALSVEDDGLFVPIVEGDGEPTVVEAGDNVTVEGTGTSDDPYVVSSKPTALQAGDNVTIEGAGTADDPYVISADANGCPPVDVEEAWTHEAEDTNGAPVFCASDGVLRTMPERYFETMRLSVTSSRGDVPLNEIVDPGTGRQTLAEAEGEFVNPSPVLPMKVVVEASLNHCQWTFIEGNTVGQIWSRVELGGDVSGVVEAHQRMQDVRASAQSIVDVMGSTKTLLVTIPPGGVMTVKLIGSLALERYSNAKGNELNHVVTIWGGN